MKPFFAYVGGKSWLSEKIKELYDPNKRLVELFCGSGAISLQLEAKRALLNDINPHLINLFNQIKNGLTLSFNPTGTKEEYLKLRQEFNNQTIIDKRNAELFYYLNKTCFNGLCRFNKKGKFNVPFGMKKKQTYLKEFKDYEILFSNWQFTCYDFREVKIEKDDFIYVDPPYTDTVFTSYYSNKFDYSEQLKLVKFLGDLKNPIVISNKFTDQIYNIYKNNNYIIEILDAPRKVASNGNRESVKEILAYKNIN